MKKKPELVLTPEERAQAVEASLKIKELFPSLFMGLNTAQYRALEDMYKPTSTGHIPKITSVEFANGVGKSHLMWLDIVGWTMGTEYLDIEAFPEEAVRFYEQLLTKRDSGKLALRLCCTADDMKAGGSVYELMKKVLPWAKASKQDNSGCFKQIDIPHPTLPHIINHIVVKTFDQPKDKHSGTTTDRIWSNENLPLDLWGETIARTRGGGTISMFATILDFSSYLDRLESSVDVIMRRSKGHMFESCKGEQVTDTMAAEVLAEIGIELEKNPNGGYITNGVLNKYDIDAQLDIWLETCPHELEARKTGKPISSGGKIHQTYSEDVHVIKDEYFDSVPKTYPMIQVVDPHPARPDASLWAVILPSDHLHIFAEWPTYDGFGYYEEIKNRRFIISEKCEIWRTMEVDFGITVNARVGDPNRFKDPNPDDFCQLSSLYSEHGFDFDLTVDDNFEFGIEKVNQYLHYDQVLWKTRPKEPAARPRLTIANRCINVRRALKNFSRKLPKDITDPITGKVDDRYGCFAGCVRYLVMWHQNHSFNEIRTDESSGGDYEAFTQGRLPPKHRKVSSAFDSHRRTVIGKYRDR